MIALSFLCFFIAVINVVVLVVTVVVIVVAVVFSSVNFSGIDKRKIDVFGKEDNSVFKMNSTRASY